MRKTDEKEFGLRGIESKIIRKHPRWDKNDSKLKVDYGRQEIFRNKVYEELCIISIYEMTDRRSNNKRAKRSGIKIKKNRPGTEPWGTLQIRGDEGEMCGGMATADV